MIRSPISNSIYQSLGFGTDSFVGLTMSESFRSFVHPLEVIKPNGPVQELLDSDAGEVWIYGQTDVGLYEG